MNKTAFTLSEVLITLGIIGVVAAITMPVLIANIQQQVLINKWKRAYTDLNQAYQLVQAEEDISDYYTCEESRCFRPVIEKIFSKYRNIKHDNNVTSNITDLSDSTKIPQYKTILGDDIQVSGYFQLKYDMNDMLFYVWSFYGGGGTVFVDVNGFNRPNVLGKDLLAIQIDKNKITPYGQYGTIDWCSGYGSAINDLKAPNAKNIQLQPAGSGAYYAGIGCSYEYLYGKRD